MTLKVDMKSLKREIAKLNKTSILEENVDASGETKDIVEKFCDAVEQALEKDGETLKKSRSIVETYNDLVDQLDKMSKESEVDTEKEEKVEKKAEKKTKASETSKVKKEKPTLATVGGGKKKIEKKEKVVKEKASKKEKVVKEKIEKKKRVSKSANSIRLEGPIPYKELGYVEKKFISVISWALKRDLVLPYAACLQCWNLLEDSKKKELLKKYKDNKWNIPKELK